MSKPRRLPSQGALLDVVLESAPPCPRVLARTIILEPTALTTSVPPRGGLGCQSPARLRPRIGPTFFFPVPLRRLGEVGDSKARLRHRLPERGRRPLEPRTALRLLQLHTTHGRVLERSLLAPEAGCLFRVSSRRVLLAKHAVRRSEPPVADQLEGWTILLGGCESDIAGRRAEPKVAAHAPRSRVLIAFALVQKSVPRH